MEYPLWLQIKQMALSLAAGGAIGLLYDMTRAGRQRMKGLFLRELADALLRHWKSGKKLATFTPEV